MTPRPILCMLLCAALMISCQSNSSLTSTGSVETTNGIAGVMLDSTGIPISAARIMLLSTDHDPYLYANSQVKPKVLQQTTDAEGFFHFDKLDQGFYNLESFHPSDHSNFLIKNLGVTTAKGVDNVEGLLMDPGKIRISLMKTGASAEDYIFLPGTTHFHVLNAAEIDSGEVVLEDIPSALYDKILLAKKGTHEFKNLIASPVAVASNSVMLLGPMSAWSQKVKVLINTTPTGANITENVTDFPMLIRLEQPLLQTLSLPIFESSQADGRDLRITKSDGTALPFEIEQWDSANGKAAVWVKMDTVYANDNQQYILLYTGNAQASSLSQGDKVFDAAAGFSGVWHLGDNSKSATVTDATGINSGTYRASSSPVITSTNSTIAGVVGRAMNFNGSNQWVDLGLNKSFVNGAEAVTLSAWVKFRSLISAQNILAFSSGNPIVDNFSVAQIHLLGKKYLEVGGRSTNTDLLFTSPDSIPIPVNTWLQVTGVLNYKQDSIYLYINGSLKSAAQVNFLNPISDPVPSAYSALASEDNGFDSFLNGALDEARVAKVARNAIWIRLNYENQKVNSTLIGFKR